MNKSPTLLQAIPVLLFALLCGICFCAADEDWLERAWQTCYADATGCRYSMYIDVNGHNLGAFQHQLQHHHKMSEEVMQAVFTNTTEPNLPAILLWLEVVTENPVCAGQNEYYSDAAGCVCRQDKICADTTSACEQGVDMRNAIFAVTVVSSVLCMAYGFLHLPGIKKLVD